MTLGKAPLFIELRISQPSSEKLLLQKLVMDTEVHNCQGAETKRPQNVLPLIRNLCHTLPSMIQESFWRRGTRKVDQNTLCTDMV